MGAKQGTTILPASTGAKGTSDSERLKAAFASSPLIGPDNALNDDGSTTSKMREFYQNEVLDGTQNGNTLMGAVNMDYGTAADTTTVATGGEGLPAGPYVPNTGSPGEGNGSNPTSIPAVPPVAGHDGDLGSVQTPKGSSQTQGSFSLTNLPAKGRGPGSG